MTASIDPTTRAHPTRPPTPETVLVLLERVRRRVPRVHAITNAVAQNFTANVLLALGAVPSMTLAPDEVAGFAASADALLVNLGTLDETRRLAIPVAMEAARGAGRPVCLDPVFVERSRPRLDFARTLLDTRPDMLRLNAPERDALLGGPAEVDAQLEAGTVLAVTGETDRVLSRSGAYAIANGHPLLARVTATGCAGGAVLAAFAAVEEDTALAAAAGLAVFGIAGEIAGERAGGPGTLSPLLLDALHALQARDIEIRLKAG